MTVLSEVLDCVDSTGRSNAPPKLIRISTYIALFLVADILFSGLAGVASHVLYRGSVIGSFGFHSGISAAFIGSLTGLLYAVSARAAGIYSYSSLLKGRGSLALVLVCALFALTLLSAFLFIVRAGPEVSRGTFLFFVPLQISLLVSNRLISRELAMLLMRRGALAAEAVVVVGDDNELSKMTSDELIAEFGLSEVGRISIPNESAVSDGFIDRVLTLSRSPHVERIVVLMKWDDEARLSQLKFKLRRSALPATLLPDSNVRKLIGDRLPFYLERQVPSIELQRASMTPSTLFLKRFVDISIALVAILILSPLMLLAALAIRVESGGPVIFRQRRHGFDRRPFSVYKFRSMYVLEDGPVVEQAHRHDGRVTRVGRVIRSASIDELPQLFNVLKGDMSLVGPRPHAITHDDSYAPIVRRYSFRHHIKPGITGWAQVNGARGQTPDVQHMQRRVDLDLWYIENFSIWLDLFILCRTCREILKVCAF